MTYFPTKHLRMIAAFFVLFFHLSCSTDTDLLSEIVIPDSSKAFLEIKVIAVRNEAVVINVADEGVNGQVTDVTDPDNGTANVNPDNTITYTPDADAEGTDEFEFTTDTPNPDNTISTATGSIQVTITDQDKALPLTGAQVFYVTTAGKSSNTGKTEATAWSIERAFGSAVAGDLVYIKAGNYGNKNLVVKNSGTTSKPIRYIGYTNSPGDLVSDKGSTFKYGEQVDASKMPLIQGIRTNNEGKGEGIVIQESNIHISNFQIKHYEKGLRSSGANNVIENIVVTDVGDFNPANSKENAANAFVNYSGVGITLEGNNVVLKNSVVVNAGAEGIHVKRGTKQVHSYNRVYSDNPTNPCDYYYLFSSASHGNKIDHAFVYRENGLSHNGHGIICKGDASNNVFTNFEIVNTVLELSFSEVSNNLFENGVIQGNYNRAVRFKNIAGGILIANGAHHNTLKNIKVTNVEAIISFADWIDGTNSPLDATDAGNNNTFINVDGEGAAIAINFDEFAKLEGVAHNNLFKNCHFKNIDRVFHVNRPNSNNKLEGCTFENIDRFQLTSSGFDYIINPNTIFTNITQINLNFLFP